MKKDCTNINLTKETKGRVCSLNFIGLTSLKGLPDEIDSALDLSNNWFISLEFISKRVNGWLCIDFCNITTLDILPEKINGELHLFSTQIQGSLMNVFNVEGLIKVYGDSPAWGIINEYLPKKEGFDIKDVQQRLRDAGFENEAEIKTKEIQSIDIKDLTQEQINALQGIANSMKNALQIETEKLAAQAQLDAIKQREDKSLEESQALLSQALLAKKP